MVNPSAADILMIIIFCVGYLCITLEHVTRINKGAVALLMAILCWVVQFGNQMVTPQENLRFFAEQFSEISQVIFFLIGALTLVEMITAHKGFLFVANMLQFRSKRKFLWVMGAVTFFLSAVIDNLTTTIVMLTLLRRFITDRDERLLLGGAVVIAANAGGAWTPIGDVTTTMLWIGGQLSTGAMVSHLFMPSLVCAMVALGCLSVHVKGRFSEQKAVMREVEVEPEGRLILLVGLFSLVTVPVFKYMTGLPPFMGILFGLSVLWLLTDMLHARYFDRDYLRVPHALSKVDLSGALFFLGILLAVQALDTAGILRGLAVGLDAWVGNSSAIAVLIGLASAVVDNVPLVAASMSMYGLDAFPLDAPFWEMVAYCAGTGGSILVIGSAAGVVFMGAESVDFFWYMRRISVPALAGFAAGLAYYLLMN